MGTDPSTPMATKIAKVKEETIAINPIPKRNLRSKPTTGV
jgi:hypothetical protein